MRSIEVTELDSPLTKDVEVASHNADQGCQEHGEGAEYCNECGGFVD